MKRFTRLTQAHSKSLKHHVTMQAILLRSLQFLPFAHQPREADASDGGRYCRKKLEIVDLISYDGSRKSLSSITEVTPEGRAVSLAFFLFRSALWELCHF